jgi:superfamily II DNA or RNA helicase
LPGRIFLSADPPALSYREWNINEGRTPTIEGETMFCLHLSAWESGSLRLECMRCRQPLTCPHAVTALHEIIEALHDPADPLAAALVQILRVPGWSRLLERLDTGLSKIAGVPVEGQRLVWEIVRKNNNLAVYPVLQRLGKRGTWGRGQRLKLDELERHQELLHEVADREAFEGLMYSHDNHAYYYSVREQTPRQLWRALSALTGSTRVFADSARSLPISVRKVRPALSVDTGDDGFHLRLALGPAEIEPMALLSSATDGRHVVFLDAEHSRCLLALLEPETTALLRAMASFPVTLPAEGLAEFVARLPRLQSALDLHLPESVRGERVEPPLTTLCRLEPLPEAGVRLDMAVRPIASGPVFPPGEGTPEVLHARDGRHLHALRALGAERERAAHLAQVLGLDDTTANGAWRWDVSDDDVALDMLHKLRGLPELAEVEWPAGEIRVDHASRGALKVQVHRRHDWFGVEGEIEIDGARVPLSELLAAARAGRRYVRLNARHFARIEEELHQRLAALDDVVFDNKGAIELGLLAAPVLAELVEDGSQLDMVPAFRAVLGKLEAARSETATLPEGLQATLRHYQVDGFRWLARLASWGLGAVLADDMGLGKTVQALALLLRRAELGPALVIAPTSVVSNWADECAKFAPSLVPRIYRGADRAAMREELGKGTLLVTSYAIAVRDAEALGAISFSTLIIDEAQSVKNALTRRFRAVRDLQADFRLALTGTPIENHLGELWAIFRLVTPGLLGSWEQFRQRFAVPIERHHDRKRQTALACVVRPFLLRRTKAEVAPELPSRTEMNQTVELGPTERRLYEAERIEILENLAKSAAAGIGDEARQRIKILAALTRLRLLCCHPRLVVKDSTAGSAKLAALVELLTELRDEGHRALVFSQFTSFLDLARPLLTQAGLRTLSLDGSTPAAEREERVRAFQAGTADAFLLSLRAGGTGLNLTAATYVIHLDPWWNPAVEDQATDRAHRIGQDRPVTVIRMVARNTIEEAVLSLHEEKRQLAASILDGADMAARLDGEDLLDLIRKGGVAGEDEDAESEARNEGDTA